MIKFCDEMADAGKIVILAALDGACVRVCVCACVRVCVRLRKCSVVKNSVSCQPPHVLGLFYCCGRSLLLL